MLLDILVTSVKPVPQADYRAPGAFHMTPWRVEGTVEAPSDHELHGKKVFWLRPGHPPEPGRITQREDELVELVEENDSADASDS
jgi:hypothetical protein